MLLSHLSKVPPCWWYSTYVRSSSKSANILWAQICHKCRCLIGTLKKCHCPVSRHISEVLLSCKCNKKCRCPVSRHQKCCCLAGASKSAAVPRAHFCRKCRCASKSASLRRAHFCQKCHCPVSTHKSKVSLLRMKKNECRSCSIVKDFKCSSTVL